MLFSKLFVPTLREVPSDAEAISHKLLLRAGFVRQLSAGLYIYLPLGVRVIERIYRIIRQEMDAIGAQEVTMPVLHPAEIWQRTGRWDSIGEEMFRLKDRGGRDMCLGMTHEEIMTWLASQEIRSYRDLPQVWYQLQTKLRDEARPKSGILRTREFVMKDSYSFDRDEEGLAENYRLHIGAYDKIYERSGLAFYMVQSDTGMMGGSMAHEYMAVSPAGEDTIVLCDSCGYAANVELAISVAQDASCEGMQYAEVHTPSRRTVTEVSSFLKLKPGCFIKSLLLITEKHGPVLALVRGDHALHEKKMTKILQSTFRPATKEEVRDILGVEAGFIGPQGHSIRIIADVSLRGGVFVAGANKADHHMTGIRPEEHFKAEWHDIRAVVEGDLCSGCGAKIRTEPAIEIGNIFKLGTKYSAALGANFLDEDGKEKPIIMGSYGIGPARIMAAAVEQCNDKDGIIWPRTISPFDVEVLPLNMADPKTVEVANMIYGKLAAAGLEVLFDDREERAGVKFKDADLIGIPTHVVIGEKTLKEGLVELKDRKSREVVKLTPDEAITRVLADVRR